MVRILFRLPLWHPAFEGFFPSVIYGSLGVPVGYILENWCAKRVNMSRVISISAIVLTLLTLVGWAATSGWAASPAKQNDVHILRGHNASVTSVAFSSDGRLALTGSNDESLKLWEVVSGVELRTMRGHGASVTSVAFSPDGMLALSASGDHTLILWELKTGKKLRTLKQHEKWIERGGAGRFSRVSPGPIPRPSIAPI